MPKPTVQRERGILVIGLIVAVALGAFLYLSRPTTLSIAVAPEGGTEPALMRAYAAALAEKRLNLRLRIVPFDGVRESAEALQAGKVDLAVVRPDILLPANGLTLAVLREQAALVASPESAGIGALPELAGKRLGTLARRGADRAVIRAILEPSGLDLLDDNPAGPVPEGSVALVPVEEGDLAAAFAQGRIEAAVVLTTPTSPAAQRLVGIVREASASRAVSLFGVPDVPAVLARLPRLQAVTVPAGLFGGNPKLPAEDIATIGASYRLMGRATLSRSVAAEVTEHLFELRSALADGVPAANDMAAPAYDTTAAATSARLPIHPGAIDYFEREQQGFIERYETWIYLVAFLGGGIGSTLAWLRQRLWRARRERIEIATGRLLEIRSEARRLRDASRLALLADEIDSLAANIARYALNRPTEPRSLSAARIAIDAARSTVQRASAATGGVAEAPRQGPDQGPDQERGGAL
ncbi:TAXI family TRAP transporter solute-binding subunit [Methylobacterium planeticum]|uniref:C4-dicarboxylate ABC transporter substrate-binding protein n=1 Tax=Methylobacterium planeticum TaxID=2615211 RepID=A0A6N6MLX8_9HYPH|nr:TAXI family TRAP transporter solute-binding subunit [Methylobacterium planeticum]KAB1070213.1 C4-dicarboxylate ABC transporter substrate-binding protein [Methylobacterium planeticum]